MTAAFLAIAGGAALIAFAIFCASVIFGDFFAVVAPVTGGWAPRAGDWAAVSPAAVSPTVAARTRTGMLVRNMVCPPGDSWAVRSLSTPVVTGCQWGCHRNGMDMTERLHCCQPAGVSWY